MFEQFSDHAEKIIVLTANKIQIVGAGVAGTAGAVSRFSDIQSMIPTIAGVIGVLMTVIGFCVSWHFQRVNNRRNEERHQLDLFYAAERNRREQIEHEKKLKRSEWSDD